MLATFITYFDSFFCRPLLKITFLMVYEDKNCCFSVFTNKDKLGRFRSSLRRWKKAGQVCQQGPTRGTLTLVLYFRELIWIRAEIQTHYNIKTRLFGFNLCFVNQCPNILRSSLFCELYYKVHCSLGVPCLIYNFCCYMNVFLPKQFSHSS